MTDRSKVKTVTQVKNNPPCENKRQALSQIKRIDWTALDFRTKNQKSFYRDTNFIYFLAIIIPRLLTWYLRVKSLAMITPRN